MLENRHATRRDATMNQMAKQQRNIAVIGAGIAGLACARTLAQAGHRVTVLEKGDAPGGRMASCDTPFGSFDHGAQYFTVRDARFEQALDDLARTCASPGAPTPCACSTRTAAWPRPPCPRASRTGWACPAMDALAAPLGRSPCWTPAALELRTRVTRIERDALDPERWQLQTSGPEDSVHVYSGFDAVLLAMPSAAGRARCCAQSALAPRLAQQMETVEVAPCWTLMLAFPQAVQPDAGAPGPAMERGAQHAPPHRLAGARIVQAAAAPRWSAGPCRPAPPGRRSTCDDDAPRVQAKLLKAFAEVTGIHAEPALRAGAPLALGQDAGAAGRSRTCGTRKAGHRRVRRLVPGPSRRRRFRLRPGAGAGGARGR